MDQNLWILLLDHQLRIISSSGDDEEIDKELYSRIFDLKSYPMEGYFHIEKIHGKDLSLFLTPIDSNIRQGIQFRFIILGLDKEREILEKVYLNLNRSITNLFEYDHTEFNDYQNLLRYLDAVDDGISACDAEGIVTYINKSGANIFDIKKEDILGKNIKPLISDTILGKVVESENTYQDLEYSVDLYNKNVHLMTSAYPVYDKDHNIIGAIDIFRRIKRSIKAATGLAGYGALYTFDDFIGKSKVLSDAIELSKKFAYSDKNILIAGESGTGKELFAQSIHNHSLRKNNPFVAINCASYPKELFDSELFGYVEGAFTGAIKGGKAGKFELADGGTIFLDEIGEMPLNLQAKLLRVIESKSITRIGSNKNVDIDVRIIAATNRNLEEMIKLNSFREDLYFRLRVLYLYLDSLRNREDDSVLLSNYFIQKFSNTSPKPIKGLDKDATQFVKEYEWPGNIRELENVISLALFYCQGNYITREDLINAGLKEQLKPNIETSTLSEVSKEIIIKTLEKNKGNKKKTAEELGISRSTIYRLLSK